MPYSLEHVNPFSAFVYKHMLFENNAYLICLKKANNDKIKSTEIIAHARLMVKR